MYSRAFVWAIQPNEGDAVKQMGDGTGLQCDSLTKKQLAVHAILVSNTKNSYNSADAYQ